MAINLRNITVATLRYFRALQWWQQIREGERERESIASAVAAFNAARPDGSEPFVPGSSLSRDFVAEFCRQTVTQALHLDARDHRAIGVRRTASVAEATYMGGKLVVWQDRNGRKRSALCDFVEGA